VAASATFDADYQAVLDAVTANGDSLPTSTQQATDNQLLIDYKATGGWVKDDAFFKFKGVGFGTGLIGYRLMDWKRLIKATAYGSLTWSDTGAKGNAANAYIDPLYIATDGVNWKANDAGAVIGISKMPTISAYIFGYNSSSNHRTRLYIYENSANDIAQINHNNFGRVERKSIVGLNGIYANATQQTFITDGTTSVAVDTQSLPEATMSLLAYNNTGTIQNFTDAEIDYVTFGADKRAEHEAMKTVLE